MTNAVWLWWYGLCAVSLCNVLALAWSARRLHRRKKLLPAGTFAARRWQLLLCGAYVLGCAYRSLLPVFDVQRLCLFDSWLSSVLVGRSVATVAELCFVAQWALLMREIAQVSQSPIARRTAGLVLPLIALAEMCSWYSVLTTANIGHVAEESLWGLTAALLVLGLMELWPRADMQLRRGLLGLCLLGGAYVGYMVWVDVPMYWGRWMADQATGRNYLSLAQGLQDTAGRWVVSHQWQSWKSEVVWMTLYFSAAVWLSIGFVHTPAFARQRSGTVIALS